MAFSFVIKNATVIDGTGKEARKTDVGIEGKEIKTIGTIRGSEGGELIEGKGLFLMPGMIDLTNHADRNFSLFHAPQAENLVRQGITTIVTGACGISLAPLTKPEDINIVSHWVDTSALNTDWLSFAEFRATLSRQKLGVNVATLVGHATIAHHKDSMHLLLEQALVEGARGVSFSLHHAPGQSVSEDFLLDVAGEVYQRNGIISIHVRDEGAGLLSSVAEAIRIARMSGVRMHIAHLRALGRTHWPDFTEALAIIRRARDEGVAMSADVVPYGRTDALLVNFLPAWAREGGDNGLRKYLIDIAKRQEIERDLHTLTLHPDRILFAFLDKEKELVGKTLAQAADLRGVSPEAALLEIIYANDFRVRVFSKTISQINVQEAFQEDFVVVSSNGEIVVSPEEQSYYLEKELPHPRSFGALPRFFDRFVKKDESIPRDESTPGDESIPRMLSWEKAVQKATSLPAAIIGLTDRGIIKTGARADLVLFDPETIKDNATYLHPYQYSDGINYVFVNGKPVFARGTFHPLAAGEVL
jgi:N-acyl-D-amino-acid deacylase